MSIVALSIVDFRVIKNLALTPGEGVNVVSGDNGAGKTSILEAIYLSGRGRSFRHADARPLVRTGAEQAQVVAKILNPGTSRSSTLGIARGPREFRCRLDGADVRRRSALAEALPVQWIGSQPQVLLERGPDVRRRFIDMAVFHVEHAYLEVMIEYQRILKQRNAALRSSAADRLIAVWDEPLAAAAERMDASRRDALTHIFDAVNRILHAWNVEFTISYRYRSGWGKGKGENLIGELSKRLEVDRSRGFTSKGPHRAELEIQSADGLADKVLSRGQQKMLVIAMHLAVIETIGAQNPARLPVLLIDDLAAELDYNNRQRVMVAVLKKGCQAFATRLTDDRLPEVEHQSVFHVEHGELK